MSFANYRNRIGVLIVFILLYAISTRAQGGHEPEKTYGLELSTDFTSIVVFPASIIPRSGVDLGSPLIKAKRVGTTSNVLKVKAGSNALPYTNLTVFTTDGKLYRFEVRYKANPSTTFFDFTVPGAAISDGVKFENERLNDAAISALSKQLSNLPSKKGVPRSKSKGGVRMGISGTYLVDGVLFFQIWMENSSAIPFDIDFSRSYISDRRKAKRTSVTQFEVLPVSNCCENGRQVGAKQRQRMVMAFEKFTIAEDKFFIVELYEKNGDRHLLLKLRGKHLLRARPLMTLY